MLNLVFYSFEEKTPEINKEISYIRTTRSFGMAYFEVDTCIVEAQWTELEDGEDSGQAYIVDTNDLTPPEVLEKEHNISYRLDLLIDGYFPKPKWYWVYTEDYVNALEKHLL